MKAINRNGIIKIYNILPTEWEGIQNFNKSTEEELYNLGFREVELVQVLPTQILGPLYFDEITDSFKHEIFDKTSTDLDIEVGIKKEKLILKFESDTDALIKSVVGERVNEYLLAEKEAIAFKAGGYIDADVTPSISSDAIANGRSNTEACDLILTMAANWRAMQTALRENRLLAKANAKNATTLTELQTVQDTWDVFIALLKTQIVG